MSVVCKDNDPDGKHSNNEHYCIQGADDITVDLRADDKEITMLIGDFCEKFEMAFAITVDCTQIGRTRSTSFR